MLIFFVNLKFRCQLFILEFHKLKITFFQKVSASIVLYVRKLFEKMQFSIYEILFKKQ